MRVLLVSSRAAPFGGGEVMTDLLRDGLRDRGHDVRVLAGAAHGRPQAADYAYVSPDGRASVLLRPGNPTAPWALHRALRDFEPDVVHVRGNPTRLTPAMLAPLRTGAPSLFHATGVSAVCPTGTKLLAGGRPCTTRAGGACVAAGCMPLRTSIPTAAGAALWRRWRGAFDAFVANSESTRLRLLGDGVAEVRTIPNGTPLVAARPRLANPPTVSCASRLERPKGVDVLIRAFARARTTLPHARLVLAGDGPERAALERLARALGVRDAVEFHGHVAPAEVGALLAGAWVHAVPSLSDEGFGLSAAEALMRGTAVVASDAGGLSEVVDHGQTGTLVPPGAEAALAAALCDLLADREHAERAGAAAREDAVLRFSPERCLARFEQLYGELTQRRPAAVAAAL